MVMQLSYEFSVIDKTELGFEYFFIAKKKELLHCLCCVQGFKLQSWLWFCYDS